MKNAFSNREDYETGESEDFKFMDTKSLEEYEGGEEEKDDEEEEEEESAAASIGEMKKGDYMIHVHIENCKEIRMPENTTVNPMVEVHCLG